MKKSTQIFVLLTYILMIVVNTLANTLPINGVDTGVISDSYPNLFAPAGITFAIWGIIYILLGMFTFYQLGIINKNDEISNELLNSVGITFTISSIINACWIFAWHYQIIWLSLILMLLLLSSLMKIVITIKEEKLNAKEKLFVKVPFSVYFGWITVATIANVTIFLVSLNLKSYGFSEPLWAVLIIIVGALVGSVALLRNKDYFYGLVIIWAYLGILIKHTTVFNSMYTSVIVTTIVCLIVVLAATIYAFTKKEY
ncbi:MAG: tryptophan-rich sensory protein [Sphaerochaetaceae bacterium]|nr:tryptophan-rich sensory protein [Sphaerochaetaceae bacterium]